MFDKMALIWSVDLLFYGKINGWHILHMVLLVRDGKPVLSNSLAWIIPSSNRKCLSLKYRKQIFSHKPNRSVCFVLILTL